jgi:capsular exopolysaccharide synthesis family protein
MNKFSKALEQAQRDRHASGEGHAASDTPVAAPPPLATPSIEPMLAGPGRTEIPPGVDEHLVSLLTPGAYEAEQYRALRHTVEQMQHSTGLKVIAVTSAGVGDGKTTTAINLAGALAQAPNARVLVVDADLRHPSVGDFLGLYGSNSPDLVSAITDPALRLAQALEERPPFNLSVLRTEQSPTRPYELLKSPRVGALLDEARASFDYVIVDAPPLVAVQDCRVIGEWVDGFLLVVHAHRTPRRLLEEALNVVDPSKLIGLVFNGDDQPRSGNYSRDYAGHERPGTTPWAGRWRR